MGELDVFRELLTYSDRANRLVYEAAAALSPEQLDRPLEVGPGPGTLRRVLIHIHAGESTWLKRWRGEVEAKWPDESVATSPGELLSRLRSLAAERDAFINALDDATLVAEQAYRDSKGSLFRAALRQMLLQGIVHSIHHRAQAVNAIRRLGGAPPEVDLMVTVRQPA